MPPITRRDFIAKTGRGAATSAAIIAAAGVAKAAPGERVRHAVIGSGGQGRQHARAFSALPDCDVVALCDVDPERIARALEVLPNRDSVATTDDFRRILDDDSIDTVSIATPDHWHTPIAIHALIAGKHVYIEKPCSHNVAEALALEAAAAKSGKCVQHGTQSRSGSGIRDAIKFVHEGGIGKVRFAKAINHQFREPIGRAAEEAPPAGVNYDRWMGPAPERPFTRNRWHYNWHWMWDYGTGDLGNDGVHQLDIARWGLGVRYPSAVTAPGGQLFYDDDHETPDTQIVTYEFDGCYLMFEMRLWTNYKMDGHDNGNVFYGDRGILEIGRNGCEVTLIGEEKRKIGGGADFEGNIANFVACVKANDPSGLNAPISEGVASTNLCHLGNIATRVQRRLRIDAEKVRCVGDDEANGLLSRSYRKGYELPAYP